MSVSLSCVHTGAAPVTFFFRVASAKDLLLLFSSLFDDTPECFTFTSCGSIELILTHVLSTLLSYLWYGLKSMYIFT